jgi:hypothetical protein
MRMAIYCPCKVKEIGVAVLDGDFDPYVFGGWIIDQDDPRGLCKHCGQRVKIVGDDPQLDKQYEKFLEPVK